MVYGAFFCALDCASGDSALFVNLYKSVSYCVFLCVASTKVGVRPVLKL